MRLPREVERPPIRGLLDEGRLDGADRMPPPVAVGERLDPIPPKVPSPERERVPVLGNRGEGLVAVLDLLPRDVPVDVR